MGLNSAVRRIRGAARAAAIDLPALSSCALRGESGYRKRGWWTRGGRGRARKRTGRMEKNKTLGSRAGGFERGRIHRSWPMAVPTAGFQLLLFFTGRACLFMSSERWAKSAAGACRPPPASLELRQERQPASGLVPYSRFSPLNVAPLFR